MLWYVWRWCSTRWRPDFFDPDRPDDPVGHTTREEAQARIQKLIAYRGKKAFPPPVATLGAVPRMKPRKKTMLAKSSPAEVNGHTYATAPAGPVQRTRTATGAERRGRR